MFVFFLLFLHVDKKEKVMKKSIVLGMSALLLLGSCDSYTGMGAYTGTTLGSIFGSAIGGIAGGPHGSDIGTVVGMAGGAVVGAAVGQAADQHKQEQRDADIAQMQQDRAQRQQDRVRRQQARTQHQPGTLSADDGDTYGHGGQTIATRSNDQSSYDSGFDPNNKGDDRIYDFNGSDYTGNESTQKAEVTMPKQSSVEDLAAHLSYTPNIEIRNARFLDDNQDGKIERGEMCKVIFEVFNRGQQPLNDLVPTVVEANGNRHILISPSMHVEKLMPGSGIRYTALVKADNRLKDGTAKICVSVVQGGKAISKVSEFNIPTVK